MVLKWIKIFTLSFLVWQDLPHTWYSRPFTFGSYCNTLIQVWCLSIGNLQNCQPDFHMYLSGCRHAQTRDEIHSSVKITKLKKIHRIYALRCFKKKS